VELVASDDDLEGDLTFELLGSYPATDYFYIQEVGNAEGKTQRVSIRLKKQLAADPLESLIYLVIHVD